MLPDKPPSNWPFPTWKGQPIPRPPAPKRVRRTTPAGEPALF